MPTPILMPKLGDIMTEGFVRHSGFRRNDGPDRIAIAELV
jgi:hypothetical protein